MGIFASGIPGKEEEAKFWFRLALPEASVAQDPETRSSIENSIAQLDERIKQRSDEQKRKKLEGGEQKGSKPEGANAAISTTANAGITNSSFSFSFGFPIGGYYNSFSTPLPFYPANPDQIFLSGPNGLDTYCTQGKPCELRGNDDLTQSPFNSLHSFGGIEFKFAHISDDREIFASGAFQRSSDMYGWIVGIGYATSAELLPQSWWKPSLRMGLAIVAGASTFSTNLKSTDTKPIEFNQYGTILSTTKDTAVEAPSGIQGGLRAEFDFMFRRKFSIGVHPSGLTAGSNRFSFWVPVVLRFHFEESLSKSNTSAKGATQ